VEIIVQLSLLAAIAVALFRVSDSLRKLVEAPLY
jgi:hypothetical protein